LSKKVLSVEVGGEALREIYAASREGGLVKDYGLATQLQRAAVSVMFNAEGFERNRRAEFHQVGRIVGALRKTVASQWEMGGEEALSRKALSLSRIRSTCNAFSLNAGGPWPLI
jgi:four helix bundle protein